VTEASTNVGRPITFTTKYDATVLIGGLNCYRYTVSYEKEGHEKTSQEVQVRIGERNRLGDVVLPRLPEDYVRPEVQEYFDAGIAASDAKDYEKAVEYFLSVL
jgi:hypothetical protein